MGPYGRQRPGAELFGGGFFQRHPIAIEVFLLRAFEALRDDPRFIALRQRNLQRINEERDILGFKPLTAAFYDEREASLKAYVEGGTK